MSESHLGKYLKNSICLNVAFSSLSQIPTTYGQMEYRQTPNGKTNHCRWAKHYHFNSWQNAPSSVKSFILFCKLCWHNSPAQCNTSSGVWQDPGWHTLKVKAYTASGSSTTNRKHRPNRIIHGFLLMSWKHPSSTADLSLLKQQRTKYKARCASNFHCATCHISAVLQLAQQQPHANSEGQQEVKNSKTVSRPIGHRCVGLSAWTLTSGSCALSGSDTCVLAVSESSWLVKSQGGKASRPRKRSTTFGGAPCWIIQTVPVVTISIDTPFPSTAERSHIYIRRDAHTPCMLNIYQDWWRRRGSRERKVLVARLCCQIELSKISSALVCRLCLVVMTSAEKHSYSVSVYQWKNELLCTQWEVVKNKQWNQCHSNFPFLRSIDGVWEQFSSNVNRLVSGFALFLLFSVKNMYGLVGAAFIYLTPLN